MPEKPATLEIRGSAPVAGEPSRRFFIRAMSLMSPRERLGACLIVAISLLSGFLEIGILGLVGPVVYALFHAGSLSESKLGTFLAPWLDPADQTAVVTFLVTAIAALMIASAGVRLLTLWVSERHAAACRTRLSKHVLSRLVDVPIEWSQRFSAAEKINLVQGDVATWRNEFVQSALVVVQSSILVVLPAAAVVALAPTAGIAAIVTTAIVVAAIVAYFRRHIRNSARAAASIRNVAVQRLLQIVSGIREVKLSGNMSYFVSYFDKPNRDTADLGIVARIWAGSPGILIHTFGQIGFLGSAIVLWVTSENVTAAAATMAVVAVFFARVLPAFNAIGSGVAQLQRSAAVVHSVLDVLSDLDAANRAQAETRTVEPPLDWGQISIENVYKTYPGAKRPAFFAHRLVLERGKVYGVVGRSGAGKSTLANILVGLASPTAGRVLIGDVDLASVEIRKWHRSIGYVAQAPFLFDATLVENITCGEPLDDARLAQVLEEARLSAFVAAQPRGLDTNVGERGGRMSGGQIQRVSIARAVYRRPSILIFDEATSAMDGETEREIQTVLAARAPERLTLIIAHRINTLKECDEIILLEDGEVRDQGSYRELAARSALFKAMLEPVPHHQPTKEFETSGSTPTKTETSEFAKRNL